MTNKDTFKKLIKQVGEISPTHIDIYHKKSTIILKFPSKEQIDLCTDNLVSAKFIMPKKETGSKPKSSSKKASKDFFKKKA